MTARRLSEASDDEMRALTGTSGVLCDKCGSTGHNTAGHDDSLMKLPGIFEERLLRDVT